MSRTWRSALTHLVSGLLLAALLLTATPARAQEGGSGVLVRTTVNLHLRAAPSTASRIYDTAPLGTVVRATAISPNYRWLRVTYSGQEGWMFRAYTEVESGSVAALPVSGEGEPPAVVSGYVPPETVIVSPMVDVNVRMEPNAEADLITYIPVGQQVSALAVTPEALWVLVQFGSYRGWVNGRYLNVVSGSLSTLPPYLSVGPDGIAFGANRTFIAPGDCVTVSWAVQGEGSVNYKARTVYNQGSRTECPTQTTRYTLTVVRPGYQVVQRELIITVGVLDITFTADNETVSPGQCTTLRWETSGVSEVYYQDQPVDTSGWAGECPTQTTTYTLRAVTLNGETVERQVTVNVAGTSSGTVTINFSADRYTISTGQCATLFWSVFGAQTVYYQDQPVAAQGARQECPTQTTTYTLRAVTADNQTFTRDLVIFFSP